MDLATETYYKIDKDKCLDFETENIVLYLPISEYSNTEYLKRFYELKTKYENQLLISQSVIIKEELQKEYVKKYKEIYPYFQEIETVLKIPIDEYLDSHDEDGFIENYCLPDEVKLRVKLYRKQKNNLNNN